MTTYTVLTQSGDVVDRGLTLSQACDEIMRSDGREWEIRGEPGEYAAWSRQQVASRPWACCYALVSYADTLEAAEAEIYETIICSDWRGHNTAVTDESYDEMMAEAGED